MAALDDPEKLMNKSGIRPLSKLCRALIENVICDGFLTCLVIFSSITLAFNPPLMDPNHRSLATLAKIDLVVAIIFICEMAIKLVAYGIWEGDDAYFKDPWNFLDAFVVFISILSMASGLNISMY